MKDIDKSETVCNIEQETAQRTRFCIKITLLTSLLVLIAFIGYEYEHSIASFVFREIEKFSNSESWTCYFFFLGAQQIFALIPVPGLAYFNITMGYFMKNFYKSWLIATLGGWFGSQTVFVLSRYLFKNQSEKIFEKSKMLKILKHEISKNPWKTSILVHMMIIPPAIKNNLLPLTSISFRQYVISSFPFYIGFSALLCGVGSKAKSIAELTSKKSLKELSSLQIIEIITTWSLLIATVCIVIFACYYARKKVLEAQDEEVKEDTTLEISNL